jgi:hypothetical protein
VGQLQAASGLIGTCPGYSWLFLNVFSPLRRRTYMKKSECLATLALGLFLAFPAISMGQGMVTITSPVQGASLDAMDENLLVYEVDPGPRGDHVHVYVDNKEVGILRKLKGSYTLETLSAGKRNICVKVVNKAHVPVGIEKCVQVAVK